MFYLKSLNKNKFLIPYKKIKINNTDKDFNTYLHLPDFFRYKYLFYGYTCRHERYFYRIKTERVNMFKNLKTRKQYMNKIVNLSILLSFLINDNPYTAFDYSTAFKIQNRKEEANEIIKELKKIWVNYIYEDFIFCLNKYKSAYKLINKKNNKTGKIEKIKKYDIAKRYSYLHSISFIEYHILDIFNKPVEAFSINSFPILLYIMSFEKFPMEKEIENILERYIDKKDFINQTDYYSDDYIDQEFWEKI